MAGPAVSGISGDSGATPLRSSQPTIERPSAVTVPIDPASRPLNSDVAPGSQPRTGEAYQGFRPQVEQIETGSKKFTQAVKDRWDEYGVGAPFKAVSDVLIKNPFEPMSKAGIIGWLKVLVSLPMELVASTVGFFSKVVTNTGPEIKALFTKADKKNIDVSAATGTAIYPKTEIREENENDNLPQGRTPLAQPGASNPSIADQFETDSARERARDALSTER